MITIKYNQTSLTLPAPATLGVTLSEFATPLLSVLGLPASTAWRQWDSHVVDGATYDLAFYIEPAPAPEPEPAAPTPAPAPEPARFLDEISRSSEQTRASLNAAVDEMMAIAASYAAPAPEPAPAAPTTLTVLVKYGIGNTISRVVPVGSTIGALLADPQVKGALGYGANVQGFVAGVPQGSNIPLRDSDVVSVHDVACTKA